MLCHTPCGPVRWFSCISYPLITSSACKSCAIRHHAVYRDGLRVFSVHCLPYPQGNLVETDFMWSVETVSMYLLSIFYLIRMENIRCQIPCSPMRRSSCTFYPLVTLPALDPWGSSDFIRVVKSQSGIRKIMKIPSKILGNSWNSWAIFSEYSVWGYFSKKLLKVFTSIWIHGCCWTAWNWCKISIFLPETNF